MALSRRSFLAWCATVGGTAVLAALAMSPTGAAAAAPAAALPAAGLPVAALPAAALPAAALPAAGLPAAGLPVAALPAAALPAAALPAAGLPAAAPPVAAGCSATARIEAQWGSGTTGGQIVTVVVTNTSAATTTKWAAAWTLGAGRRVVSAWNADVATAGGVTTAVNAFYNGVLAPAASTRFGLQLSGVAPAPVLSCDNGSTPPGGSEVTVTQTDNLATVRLRVGDTLVVSLTSLHLPPKLSTAGVLSQLDVVGGYPTGQPLVARYTAAAAGTVDVSTTTDIACNHDPIPCPSPSVPWLVHVIVTA